MNLDFEKGNGLIPVIIQHDVTLQVLMMGYMNEEALAKTKREGRVTFYSRTKQRLWTKGEQSRNYLVVQDLVTDCDSDSLLIKVQPSGPTCHLGTTSCFGQSEVDGFIYELESVIDGRIEEKKSDSYTYQLYKKGINKVAQKVGEEAVELLIEAKDNEVNLFDNEVADLLYHLLILLKIKGRTFSDIERVLKERHR